MFVGALKIQINIKKLIAKRPSEINPVLKTRMLSMFVLFLTMTMWELSTDGGTWKNSQVCFKINKISISQEFSVTQKDHLAMRAKAADGDFCHCSNPPFSAVYTDQWTVRYIRWSENLQNHSFSIFDDDYKKKIKTALKTEVVSYE